MSFLNFDAGDFKLLQWRHNSLIKPRVSSCFEDYSFIIFFFAFLTFNVLVRRLRRFTANYMAAMEIIF